MKIGDLVAIYWGDAWSAGGWYPIREEHKAEACITVGFVTQNNKNGVTVASRQASDGQVGAVSFIPKGMISKIKKINFKVGK